MQREKPTRMVDIAAAPCRKEPNFSGNEPRKQATKSSKLRPGRKATATKLRKVRIQRCTSTRRETEKEGTREGKQVKYHKNEKVANNTAKETIGEQTKIKQAYQCGYLVDRRNPPLHPSPRVVFRDPTLRLRAYPCFEAPHLPSRAQAPARSLFLPVLYCK